MNWGLGHATRCIPVIRALRSRGCEVILAADGHALKLLRSEFPSLQYVRLSGYDIRYWWSGNAVIQILLQLPKLFFSFYQEKKWLKRFVIDENIDVVISDNRYGLTCKTTQCIFITHQICIQLPKPLKGMEKFLYHLNKRFIGKFDECWIPDFEGDKNLSGDLSHKFSLPGNTFFIGPLSRFSFEERNKECDLLMVISGPESQRTKFENLLAKQAKKLSLKILLVRGVPGNNRYRKVTENFSMVDFLNAKELNDAFLTSKMIIARSGYSTIMDLMATQSKAVLIPTPGQTEQEYLAGFFTDKHIFYSEEQDHFNLSSAMEKAATFDGAVRISANENLIERIEHLLHLPMKFSQAKAAL
jgi:uncharacterized protein (TIGR00661 family)